jgi:hypothetical protein
MNAHCRSSLLVVAAPLLVFACGCGQSNQSSKPGAAAEPTKVAAEAHTHDGWWCDEHGVPEEACGLCDSKLAAEFQKKGDWCKEHDRPGTQCFVCHPELAEKFAAQYVAKYGKQPPKVQ